MPTLISLWLCLQFTSFVVVSPTLFLFFSWSFMLVLLSLSAKNPSSYSSQKYLLWVCERLQVLLCFLASLYWGFIFKSSWTGRMQTLYSAFLNRNFKFQFPAVMDKHYRINWHTHRAREEGCTHRSWNVSFTEDILSCDTNVALLISFGRLLSSPRTDARRQPEIFSSVWQWCVQRRHKVAVFAMNTQCFLKSMSHQGFLKNT